MRNLFPSLPIAALAVLSLSLVGCDNSSGGSTPAAKTDATATSDTKTVADTTAASDSGASDGATAKDTAATDAAKADAKADVKKDTAPPVDTDGTIDGASDLVLDDKSGALLGQDALDPTGDVDYWKFDGKKGQLVSIYIESNQSSSSSAAFDPATIDSIITVYGPDKKQIAWNDDPSSFANNDSSILTVLPATGTYYVRVEECWTYVNAHPNSGGSCAQPQDKDNFDYALVVFDLDPTKQKNLNPAAAEPNDATATVVGYEQGSQGYLNTVLYGYLETATDVDMFKFTPPADAKVSEGRATCHFDMGKGGVEGNGSTLDGLVVSVASESTPTVVLAQADVLKGAIAMPCDLEKPYIVTVKRITASKTGTADFYVLSHYVGGSNPLEKNEAGNDVAKGAEAMTSQQTSQGLDAFYIGGDIINDGKDVDYFSMKLPAGAASVTVYCGSASEGSGLTGFKAELRTDADAAITGGSGVEDGAKGLQIKDVAVPAGATTLLLRLSAAGQDATVKGAFYLCGLPVKTK